VEVVINVIFDDDTAVDVPRRGIAFTHNNFDIDQQVAGVRSIPIPWDADIELVDELFYQVDGVLFPGGASSLPIAGNTTTAFLLGERHGKNDITAHCTQPIRLFSLTVS
jgi:hypothetical protein